MASPSVSHPHKRAVIYARVSDDSQGGADGGLRHQTDACLAYIASQQYVLVHEPFADDFTGAATSRPALDELLEFLATRQVDMVVLHKTNRIGRKQAVQDVLERQIASYGVAIEYVTAKFDTSTPQGRFVRRVMGAADELDYDDTITKLRDHKPTVARGGAVILTRPPFGYNKRYYYNDVGRRRTQLEINLDEAHWVQQIFDWYVYGDEDGLPLSIMAITHRLTDAGVLTRHDTGLQRDKATAGFKRTRPRGTWTEANVHTLLHRETYTGVWNYRKTRIVPVPGSPDEKMTVRTDEDEWTPVPVPKIISAELFALAQERLVLNAARARRNKKFDYIFSGMVKCAACSERAGHDLAYTGKQRGKRSLPGYQCKVTVKKRTKHLCTAPFVYEAALEDAIWPWLIAEVSDPDEVLRRLAQKEAVSAAEHTRQIEQLAIIDSLIAEIEGEQRATLSLFAKGKLPEDRWEREDADYERRLAEQRRQRATIGARLATVTITPAYRIDVLARCAELRAGFAAMNRAHRYKTLCDFRCRIHIAVEGDEIAAYVTCILAEDRVPVQRDLAFTQSAAHKDAAQARNANHA